MASNSSEHLPFTPSMLTIRSPTWTASPTPLSSTRLFQTSTAPSKILDMHSEVPMSGSCMMVQPSDPTFSTSISYSMGLRTRSSRRTADRSSFSTPLPVTPFTESTKSPARRHWLQSGCAECAKFPVPRSGTQATWSTEGIEASKCAPSGCDGSERSSARVNSIRSCSKWTTCSVSFPNSLTGTALGPKPQVPWPHGCWPMPQLCEAKPEPRLLEPSKT
mmetsp:Transcript_112259/g.298358  ORF Transcript_112259/g.298358 Transcript_112259/m.298358 type:complete len:219 (+) Transcript_112259:149-805(+)